MVAQVHKIEDFFLFCENEWSKEVNHEHILMKEKYLLFNEMNS